MDLPFSLSKLPYFSPHFFYFCEQYSKSAVNLLSVFCKSLKVRALNIQHNYQGETMTSLKKLLASTLVIGSLFSANVMAEGVLAPTVATQEPVAQVQPQVQTETVSDKLNINTATAAEIQKSLIGIGAKKAEAIVQYREKHGNFTAAEQLLEVQGIGKATLDKNRDRLAF